MPNLAGEGNAPEPIAFGQISGGHIGLADLDTYTFTAASNDVISVAQLRTNSRALHSFPTRRSSDLNLAFEACSVSGLWRLFDGQRLTKTGSYTIVVRECELDGTFDYLLRLEEHTSDLKLLTAVVSPDLIAFG